MWKVLRPLEICWVYPLTAFVLLGCWGKKPPGVPAAPLEPVL